MLAGLCIVSMFAASSAWAEQRGGAGRRGQVLDPQILRGRLQLAVPAPQALDLDQRRPVPAGFHAPSRSAAFSFELPARSVLRVGVGFPRAWREPAGTCGISGLEFTDDPRKPCAEFVELTVEGHGWDHRPELATHDRRAGRSEVAFTLDAGRYVLRLTVSQNQSPTTALPAPLVAEQPALSVLEVAPTPVPAALAHLDAWLGASGLAGKVQVVHAFSTDGALGADVPAALQDEYRERLAEVGRARADAPGAEQPPDAVPTTLIRLRARMTRSELRAVERGFEERAGIPLWLRVFQKINLGGHLHARNVLIWMPVPCSGGSIYQTAPGVVRRIGPECTAATAAADLPAGVIDDVLTGTSAASPSPEIDLATEVDAFLPERFTIGEPRFEYLEKSGAYVEVLVKGLRGEVIDGGGFWERIQLSFFVTGSEETRRLRVFVDGRLASGLGGYPPDTQFTMDMEPDHAESLDVFARALVVALRDHIVRDR